MNAISVDGITFGLHPSALSQPPAHPLGLHLRSPHAAYLLAVMIGGVRLCSDNEEASQNRNYLIIGAPPCSGFVSENLRRSFVDLQEKRYGMPTFQKGRQSIRSYLQGQRANHSLFAPVLNEISRAILCKNNGRGLSGFIHLYRALEYVSYSFPLFYCRYQTVYLKAYNQLKEFFKGGELDFCSNFYKHLVKSDGLNGVMMKIEYGGPFAVEFVDCLANDVSWIVDKKTQAQAISRLSPTSIEIRLEDCFDLVVTLRNGFFHHLSGSNKSISSAQVKNADEFFAPISEIALQVIGFMFGKIIRAHLENSSN